MAMSKGLKVLLIILVVVGILVVAVGGYLIKGYNRVIALNESVSEAWGQVETQLQRRYDLVPNLVETVKGYATHEREVLTQVTEARARVGSAQTIPDKIAANNSLTSALGRLLVVVENYPDLKASQNFLNLQDELAGTENRIAVARRRYNIAAREMNTYIKGIPGVLFARIAGVDDAEYFEAPKEAQEAPKVKF